MFSQNMKPHSKKSSLLPKPCNQYDKNKTGSEISDKVKSKSEECKPKSEESKPKSEESKPKNKLNKKTQSCRLAVPKPTPGKQLQQGRNTPPKEKPTSNKPGRLASIQNEQVLTNTLADSSKTSFDSNKKSILSVVENKTRNVHDLQTNDPESDVQKKASENDFFISGESIYTFSRNESRKQPSTLPRQSSEDLTSGNKQLQEQAKQNVHGCVDNDALLTVKQTYQESKKVPVMCSTLGPEIIAKERHPSSVLARSISRNAEISTDSQPKSRRCLSFSGESWTPSRGRSALERSPSVTNSQTPVTASNDNSTVDNLRNLNFELRDQVTRLRSQLDAQKGNIKQAQWQKVVDIRLLRQQDNERLTLALVDQREKFDRDKARELEHLRDQLIAKAESDLHKLSRHKDAEISKLKLEVSCKDDMIQRLLGENRHARLQLNMDVRRSKLVEDLKELRREKKELEDSLAAATLAERSFSDELRRHSQNFETEMARVRREAQLEVKQLTRSLSGGIEQTVYMSVILPRSFLMMVPIFMIVLPSVYWQGAHYVELKSSVPA